jgi:hypothetical protein
MLLAARAIQREYALVASVILVLLDADMRIEPLTFSNKGAGMVYRRLRERGVG